MPQSKLTLNNIISNLNAIATGHKQINTFGFGDIWEINTSGDVEYPLMWAVLEGSEIREGTQIYNFNLIFADIVKGGEVNEQDVLSDQLEIAKDVAAQLRDEDYRWIVGDSTLQDFTERFTDSVAGWTMTVSLELPFDSDRCSIPTDLVSITSGASASSSTVGGTINVYLDSVLQTTITTSDFSTETITINLI